MLYSSFKSNLQVFLTFYFRGHHKSETIPKRGVIQIFQNVSGFLMGNTNSFPTRRDALGYEAKIIQDRLPIQQLQRHSVKVTRKSFPKVLTCLNGSTWSEDQCTPEKLQGKYATFHLQNPSISHLQLPKFFNIIGSWTFSFNISTSPFFIHQEVWGAKES